MKLVFIGFMLRCKLWSFILWMLVKYNICRRIRVKMYKKINRIDILVIVWRIYNDFLKKLLLNVICVVLLLCCCYVILFMYICIFCFLFVI